MTDFYFGYDGDIKLSPNKDIAMVQNRAQNDTQQIYLRLMTEPSDFTVYPKLGCDLSFLRGMPQNRSTGEIGKRIIRQALEDETKGGIFKDRQISIEAVPVSANSIRFDVHIQDNSVEPIVLSITQEI